MLKQALISLLRGYKHWLSPMLGNRCRFHPSCSTYSMTAIERHGVLRGILLTATRLLRCQPLCEGGMDPVPDAFTLHFYARNRAADPPPEVPER